MDLTRDVVHALRKLRTAPVFTAFAIASLAVGIGAATAVYAVIEATVFRAPPIAAIDEVVNIYHSDALNGAGSNAGSFALSAPDYADLKSAQTSFVGVTSWRQIMQSLDAGGIAELTRGEAVEGTFFEVLQARISLGRGIAPADDTGSAPPVVVLSDSLWRRRFGADPTVIGTAVRIGRHQFTIVGVAAPEFRGVWIPMLVPTAIWVPTSALPLLNPEVITDPRGARRLFVKGRLKPGVSVTQATSDVRMIGAQLDRAFPLADGVAGTRGRDSDRQRAWLAVPAADVYIHESIHPIAQPMASGVLVVVTVVLLVASTNLANLLLARGGTLRQEMGVRSALGASRWRLVREQLVTYALLATAGLGAGLLLAQLLIVALLRRDLVMAPGATAEITPELNASVLACAVLFALIALVVFGVGPALRLTRSELRDVLADAPAAMAPRWAGRRYLIVGQVTVSLVLAVAAALSAQQMLSYLQHNVGFSLDELTVTRLDFRFEYQTRVDDEARQEAETRARTVLAEVMDRLRGPSISSVAIASGVPTDLSAPVVATHPDAAANWGRDGRYGNAHIVSPGALRTFGVSMLSGREFTDRDDASAGRVVILSAKAARRMFGTVDVIGRGVRLQSRVRPDVPPEAAEVVGIAADTGTFQPARNPMQFAAAYVPFGQHFSGDMEIVSRAKGSPLQAATVVADMVRHVDPSVVISESGPAAELEGPPLGTLRIAAALCGLLAFAALILSMIGLSGVLTYIVSGRTREIGIRTAMGASRRDVVAMVTYDGLRPVVSGLVCGWIVVVLAGTALRAFFERTVPDANGGALVAVTVLFLAAGIAACVLPARRAVAIAPSEALRHS